MYLVVFEITFLVGLICVLFLPVIPKFSKFVYKVCEKEEFRDLLVFGIFCAQHDIRIGRTGLGLVKGVVTLSTTYLIYGLIVASSMFILSLVWPVFLLSLLVVYVTYKQKDKQIQN